MSKSNPNGSYEGQGDVDRGNTMVILSKQVNPGAPTFGEYSDNGVDAGATHIIFALYPDRQEIFDNGHGMVPNFSIESRAMFQMFKDERKLGEELDYDVRDLMPQVGACSFPWCMECIAFSHKRPEMGDRTIGMRGIGMLAFMNHGETPTWYSKPSKELAAAYYGAGSAMAINPPIAVLHAPTATAIANNNLKYRVEITDKTEMIDPLGKTHPHGTRIVITGLRDNVTNTCRPAVLADEFKKRYGALIRQGKLKLTILDKMTVEGRKNPQGRIIEVEGLSYRGVLVLNETTIFKGVPFKAEIYYESAGKNLQIPLRRMGLDTDSNSVSVASLPRLKIEPFTSGKLTGFVELPNLPESIFPLNPAKTLPMAGPVLDEYVSIIRSWKRVIEDKIEEIESRAHDKSTQDAMKDFSALAMAAIREIPILQNLMLVTAAPIGRTDVSTAAGVSKIITALVLDEHRSGVEDVPVELHHNGKVDTRLTSVRGSVSFGKREPGEYTMKVVPPEGMKVDENTFDSYGPYTTTDERQGFSAKFLLFTGRDEQEKPQRREINGRITIVQRPLSDVTLPYSNERLANGQIEINSEYSEFKRSRETGDVELRDQLIATYAAGAIVEYTMREYPSPDQVMTAMVLAGTLLRLRRSSKK